MVINQKDNCKELKPEIGFILQNIDSGLECDTVVVPDDFNNVTNNYGWIEIPV